MNPVRIADVTRNISPSSPIRARIDYKSELITCRTGNFMLKVHLKDASGIISAVAFGDVAINFDKIFEYNKVYDIYYYGITTANKTYSKLEHDYELKLYNHTQIIPYANEAGDVPAIESNFVTIDEILKMEKNTKVDCLAVCRIVDNLTKYTTANGRDGLKRNLYLVDSSKAVIVLTLWSQDACNFVHEAPFIIAIRKATITVYENEKSLNKSSGCSLEVIPASLAQNYNLNMCLDFEWLDSVLCRQTSNTLAEGYFKMKGVIHCIDCKNLYYESCTRCQKKLFKSSGDSKYFCEKCGIESSDFQYKLMIKMYIGVPFSSLEVTSFNDFVENFIGQSTEDVARALEQDPTNAEEIFKPIYYKTFIFHVHLKQRSYEGEMKPNNVVLSAMPIDVKEYNKYLIENLKKYIPIE